jgi:uncharacterized protein
LELVMPVPTHAIAFEDSRRVSLGPLADVAEAVHGIMARPSHGTLLVFDAESSQQIDLNVSGSLEAVRARYQAAAPSTAPDVAPAGPPAPRGPGRPRLGVVAREVTLMPRHWEWLASQPGGASVTLRRLVEQARAASAPAESVRLRRESAYRFMTAMAGNEVGFEEATRALFAGASERFLAETEGWPADVRDHARQLSGLDVPHVVGQVAETGHEVRA